MSNSASLQPNSAGQRRVVEIVADGEVALGARRGELVEGADELAVVAAVDAVAEGASELEGDGAGELDRQVGQAAPRVDPVGRDDRPCRAGRQAARAAAAVGGALRRIDRQRQVGVELAEEEEAARALVDQVGVLADPAEPGLLGDGLLEHRCAVGEGAVAERADVLGDAARRGAADAS